MTVVTARLLTFAAATSLAFAFAPPLFAAGSDSGDEPTATETTTTCKDGKVWDKDKKECVDPQKSGMNDTQLFQAARELAYAGQYENAIKVLRVAKNQNDPRILNYMGFANRKAGRIDLAMTYYKKALAIDGNYLLARSYMGQGLVAQGKIEEARAQLIEIRDRGGKDSYAYRSLYDALKHGSTY
jgi:tetratricopeptide (TPR) repeat protein